MALAPHSLRCNQSINQSMRCKSHAPLLAHRGQSWRGEEQTKAPDKALKYTACCKAKRLVGGLYSHGANGRGGVHDTTAEAACMTHQERERERGREREGRAREEWEGEQARSLPHTPPLLPHTPPAKEECERETKQGGRAVSHPTPST